MSVDYCVGLETIVKALAGSWLAFDEQTTPAPPLGFPSLLRFKIAGAN